MRVGILGSGEVAKALGTGFLRHGHEVMLGTRQPSKLEKWAAQNPRGAVGSFDDAARFGTLLVLAVRGSVAADALRAVDPAHVEGKTVIDATNPLAEAPPVNGVLHFFTTLEDSLMERLQREFEAVRFVKAFSCVGSPSMVDPQFKGGPPTMFICGNDEAAKKVVSDVLVTFGWEVEDMGNVEAARAIEPLCILWCIPGFLGRGWTHALKLVR
jgi:predicted dinucleotide-binding enzyme